MAGNQRKILVVEGHDDLMAVTGITSISKEQVHIDIAGSREQALDRRKVSARLKAAELRIIGFLVDADTSATHPYTSLRNSLLEYFPEIPESPPLHGLITTNSDSQRLGIWIMPDNSSPGMMEDFLRNLLPDNQNELWQHVEDACRAARAQGATFKPVHAPKAHLYTYLAWHDEPAQTPHRALLSGTLNPNSSSAEAFVKWFRELYEL